MVKATRRSAVLLGLIAVAVCAFSVPSFAEVQNVKVGGDLTVRAIHRSNTDLNKDNNAAQANGQDRSDPQDFVQQTVAINVGADLTENVSAFLRFANENDWGSATGGTASGDVDVSQAYAEIRELFYTPATLRIGTQPIKWGRGLVLGGNLLPSLLETGSFAGGDRNAAITAEEFTDFTAFDAVRLTIDLRNTGMTAIDDVAPSLDLVFIKLDENAAGSNDDTNLFGGNLSTKFGQSEAELYYLNKHDKSRTDVAPNVAGRTAKAGSVSTIGLRGSTQPGDGINLYGELAYQFGRRANDLDEGLQDGTPQRGWLTNLGAELTLADIATSPKIGAEWLFKSGEDKDGAFGGWDPIAPSYFPTMIRSYQVRSTLLGLNPVDQAGVTSAFTNQHDLALYGGIKPMEDLGVDTRLTLFLADLPPINRPGVAGVGVGNSARSSHLGTEWDNKVTYQYTDDVTLSGAYGVFWPGGAFRHRNPADAATGDSTAQQLVVEASVKF